MSQKTTAKQSGRTIDNVADAIVAAMSEGGIDHLFFTSGSEIGFYQEAIAKSRALGHNNPINLVTVPLEHISLNAALGYAAVSGRPAATAAHVDCGTQHYGGAIHTAWRSGLPVVITAGFAPTAPTGTIDGGRNEGGHLWMQENYDQSGILRNYTKWQHQLCYQDNPGTTVSRAIQVARSEPAGPVYLSVPKEISLLPAEGLTFPNAEQLGISRAGALSPEDAAQIAERLIAAKNPVVIVAHSGRNPETVAELTALSDLLGLAVIDSALRAYMCFPSNHPHFQPASILTKADAVIALDVDVPWMPNRNPPPDGAFVAAIAHDPIKERIPTLEFPADLRVAADPLLALQAIRTAAEGRLTDKDRANIDKRSSRLAKQHNEWVQASAAEAESRSRDTPIDPLWLSHQIGQLAGENSIVLDDTLPAARLPDFLTLSQPGSYFRNAGSSGGWGPGAALGAKLAAPDKDIITVTGDGFYMFGTPAPAIWAAAHHNAPFLTVVYTNRSYTTGTLAVRNTYGEDGYAAGGGYEGGYFDPPIDFAKEAEAAGGYGETVRDPADVGPALRRGLEQVRSGKPAVISVWLKRLIDGG